MSATHGIDHLIVQTHDYAASLGFWQRLGFEIEFETGHNSGMLRGANGTGVFLAEQSIEDPLSVEAYLSAAPGSALPEGVHVVSPFTATHWGTEVAVIQSPDGHRFRIEKPAGD